MSSQLPADDLPAPISAGRPRPSPIRVLLVDDSVLALIILKRMLAATPDIRVVGTAFNGKEALDLIPQLQPDVICTDWHMPVMDGFELTRAVMARFPRPILVISVSVQEEQAHNIFQLLDAGAIDVMAKPKGGLESEAGLNAQELISKIRILAGVVVLRKRDRLATDNIDSGRNVLSWGEVPSPRIIGIGASTGGPQAFQEILTRLPADFPVPIVCVQHISAGFMRGLVDWLAAQCRIRVQIATTGDTPQPGSAYFPQDGVQLRIDPQGRFDCRDEQIADGHRPSINVTFTSLAQHYGSQTVGVLLTGMGRDGIDGMLAIARAGGTTIAQDEASSIVFGMPREAIAANAARYVLPLPEIVPGLLRLRNSGIGQRS